MCCGGGVEGAGFCVFFFFQAEDGIRDLVRSRGLGDVYKRQTLTGVEVRFEEERLTMAATDGYRLARRSGGMGMICLFYTSDAADQRSSVDLGGRRLIKKKKENIEIEDVPLDTR